ncbi:uncharacterized protein N7479_004054 [Penicillium vulpinum]|uniref:uncharacterized protein n=1 Tax=Penicillium vulpinum TaxID=29845 RepID=UPI00254743FE|nr:uncharacterized protein N7479_004054 [Penicillium vulpinum]KAJ5964178.1 hypothetical protein N7479_004054 [Penicillium vulpinum]
MESMFEDSQFLEAIDSPANPILTYVTYWASVDSVTPMKLALVRAMTKCHAAGVQCVSRRAKILRQRCYLISLSIITDAYLTALSVLVINEGVVDEHWTRH